MSSRPVVHTRRVCVDSLACRRLLNQNAHTRFVHSRLVLLLVALLYAARLPVLCDPLDPQWHYQHNVWYNGLQITGIAVDEATGDIFFSDAASNRVVHQTRDEKFVAEYLIGGQGSYSPMQLAYFDGRLYVALSVDNRVAVINVWSGAGEVSYSSQSFPFQLGSCSGLAVDTATASVVVLDGWGLMAQTWTPPWAGGSEGWTTPFDFPLSSPTPTYLSSLSVRPANSSSGVSQWYMTDPNQSILYVDTGDEHNKGLTAFQFEPARLGATAQQWIDDDGGRGGRLFVLSQPAPDAPMQIAVMLANGTLLDEWTAPGRGSKEVPFYGSAMYVDSRGSQYISDHGVDAHSSSYGRVVKLARNGSLEGSWTMTDGGSHAFSSVAYHAAADVVGGTCTVWLAGSEEGVIQADVDGALLSPYLPPTDAADNRTARFAGGMASDTAIEGVYSSSSFVLLDTASPSTTKLWRFVPISGSYVLLNTSVARLGANMTGIAVEPSTHHIYLSDTRTRSVLRVSYSGLLDASFNMSGVGFVQPTGLAVWELGRRLAVADSGYGGNGAVLLLVDGELDQSSNCTLPMDRPLSVAFHNDSQTLFAADSSGYVYQFNLSSMERQFAHRPVPAATHILSMSVSGLGNVYALDWYSRRLIILSRHSKVFQLDDDWCIIRPLNTYLWLIVLLSGVAALCCAVVVAAAACGYKRRKRRRAEGAVVIGGDERLMAEHEHKHEDASKEMGRKEGEEEENDEKCGSISDGRTRVAVPEHKWLSPVRQAEATPDSGLEAVPDAGRRYEYYVARYEVVAEVSGLEDDSGQHRAQPLSTQQPLSIRTSQGTLPLPSKAPRQSSRASPATTESASSVSFDTDTNSSSSSSPTSSDYESSTFAARPAASSGIARSSVFAVQSPTHIAALHSAWRADTAPTFISSVTDLTILGEGSSGVVYRAIYQNMACVVKLPKAVALSGGAWREWQCHMTLPPHPSLVRFLGALPMSSTTYLVLGFVRQGSLHALLAAPVTTPTTAHYIRPYAVMRCMRDISAALRHMHAAGIVHRDVSCRNILVDSDGCMVLADLGLAMLLEHSTLDEQQQQTAVPVRWTSPEALAAGVHSSRSDVWSLGVALWEMTAGGALPYGDRQRNTRACIRPIVAGELVLQVDEAWGRAARISAAEQQLADTVKWLIQLCLTRDAQQRPDSERLAAEVETAWQAWRAEVGEAAERLDAEWAAWHAVEQRRLGEPSSRQRME